MSRRYWLCLRVSWKSSFQFLLRQGSLGLGIWDKLETHLRLFFLFHFPRHPSFFFCESHSDSSVELNFGHSSLVMPGYFFTAGVVKDGSGWYPWQIFIVNIAGVWLKRLREPALCMCFLESLRETNSSWAVCKNTFDTEGVSLNSDASCLKVSG